MTVKLRDNHKSQRRIRFAPPQPQAKYVIISDNDINLFEAIHRHGPLPSHYLFEFSTNKDKNTFQKRLTTLYNEEGGYLTRPREQFDSFFARTQHLIYDLSKKSQNILSEQGKLSPFIHRKDHMIHRIMGACVGASIELACREKGYTYLSRSTVLSHERCTADEMRLPGLSGEIEPDELFGIHANGKKRFYCVEIDRATEQLEDNHYKKNTIEKKFTAYLHAMENKTYQDVWGIPNMRVLIVTTAIGRIPNLKKQLEKMGGDPERFIFKAYPTFGDHWRVPQTLLPNILDDLI